MAKYNDYNLEECQCECDECGDVLVINSCDYSEINFELKLESWIIVNIKGSWHEFCSSECHSKYLSNVSKKNPQNNKFDDWND